MTFASRTRYWLPLLPLLGLLGFSYWLNQLAQTETVRLDTAKRHDPDAMVENFSAIKMNEHGVPHFIIAARKMLHYPDDDSTILEAPQLTSLFDGRPAMHASAKRATISSKGDEIFLHEEVEVLREASASQTELRVHTEYLHFVPDRQFADTHRRVTVQDAYNFVEATGLEMDNQARTLKLLAQVKSRHVPSRE